MANWCFNTVVFSGSENNEKKVIELFNQLHEQEIKEQCGQKPDFVQGDNYFFNIVINDETNIQFESRWTPIISELVEIAKEYDLNFECTYEECGNQIFGKAIYTSGNEEAEILDLTDEDHDLFNYDEEKDTYIYNGEEYEGDFEILENIWEKKFNTFY